MSNQGQLIPNGPTALRNLAARLEQQAARSDVVMNHGRGRTSFVGEVYRTAASIARQEAAQLEKITQELKGDAQ